MTSLGHLLDAHGRVAVDLRVSLTDRCNLRCRYCMPAQGLEWIPKSDTLSDDEVNRLIRIAVTKLGITTIRFTGGEPLIRPGLVSIIEQTAQLRRDYVLNLSLTTNGIGLDRHADALAQAGLDRVNISLDSLDPARYALLTRRDRLQDALAGIAAAERAGLSPIKINSVVLRGCNEDDIIALGEFCLRHGYELRFIEHMPLGPRHTWQRGELVTAQDILDTLATRFRLAPDSNDRGSAPATLWTAQSDDLPPGRIGVIASVTRPFCASCDRTRLTSDGQMRNCLFSHVETDLRGPLRSRASDEDIAALWIAGQADKAAQHGINDADFEPPNRTMSSIGG